MSDLYKEALLDAKKLKEVAEIDAKNRIMEQISPVVKQMISKEIRKGLKENFFTEQDEENPNVAMAMDDGSGEEVESAEPDTTVDPTQELSDDLGDGATEAPIAAQGADLTSITVPDADGKITVDFNDLFTDGGEEAEATATDDETATTGPEGTVPTEDATTGTEPTLDADETSEDENAMAAPVTMPESFKHFRKGLLETTEKVDEVFFSTSPVTSLTEQKLKTKLFSLMEQLDSMSARGVITRKESKLNENKLDFLYSKLKEAVSNNTYTKIPQGNGNKREESKNDMATLKEFAARLFDEEDDMAAHAREQSGISPELGGSPEDLDIETDCQFGEKPKNIQWSDAEPPLKETNTADANTDANDDVALGAAGFGDTDDEPLVDYEIDERELMEAIRKIRKENKDVIDRANVSWEDGEPEGGKEPALKHLEEQLDALEAEIDGVGDEDETIEIVDDADVDGDESDLMISVDLPDELEAMLADFDGDDFDVDVATAGGVGIDADFDGDDETIEVVDDADVDGDDIDDSEEELLLDDEVTVAESRRAVRRANKRARLAEQKLARARKLLESRSREVISLKGQLHETNLFTAKTVYLNKFLMREGLSKSTQRQIVEFLDKARTIAEAKSAYSKIKNRLNESAAATSRKMVVGSSSKVAKPGSVKLNENNNSQRRTGQMDSDAAVFDANRWKQLANIK